MPIALDVASNSGVKTSSPFTWNHTVVSGSNLFLVVCVNIQGSTTQPSASAVSYNGVAMTKVKGIQFKSSFGNYVESSIWFLHAPAMGTNTVSVTCTFGANGAAGATAISYTGAQQSDTADATNSTTDSSGGAVSFNLTTVADNCWVVGTAAESSSTNSMTSPTQTSRSNFSISGTGTTGNNATQDTNAAKTPAGNVSIGWTFDNSGFPSIAIAGASFAPASTPSIPNKITSVMGAVGRASTY